jgi:hypothetical protein
MSNWGAIGRQRKSKAQTEAARINGMLGGRPRKDGKPPVGAQFRAAIQRSAQLRMQIKEFLDADIRNLTKEERLVFRKVLSEMGRAENRWNLELERQMKESEKS